MIKKTLVIAFISIITSVFSQKTVLSFENTLKTSSSSIKDVTPIVNESNGSIAFFIADAKNVYGYKINKNFEVTDQITSVEKSRKYKILVGSSNYKNNSYRIFLTNKKQNKFTSIQFLFKSGKTSSKDFVLNPKEKFIQTVSFDNNFYLISGNKLGNELFVYSFDEKGTPKRNQIDISKLRFVDRKGKKTPLLSLLNKNENIKKFEENTPNSIELTSELTKMYVRKGVVLFTFDHNKQFTQVLEFDLRNFKASAHQFKKSFFGNKAKRSNSYINGNNIFTITATKEKFKFTALNLKTGDLIKEFSTNKNDTISFKNSPIIQEGGMYNDYRKLGKTKRFLRRITKGNTGISVRKTGKFYHIIIGGYIVQKNNAGMMMPFGGIPLVSFGSATVFFNPTQIAFNSFSNNKTTRIECLFDENFNHVKGEIEENAFDKMKNYSSNNKGSTVFKYKDFFIKTSYITSSKIFTFKKFKD